VRRLLTAETSPFLTRRRLDKCTWSESALRAIFVGDPLASFMIDIVFDSSFTTVFAKVAD